MNTVVIIGWFCLLTAMTLSPDALSTQRPGHDVTEAYTQSDDVDLTLRTSNVAETTKSPLPEKTADSQQRTSSMAEEIQTTDTPPSDREEFIENTVAKNVDLYVIGVVLIFGVIGNILCIVVLSRPRLRCRVASTYMIALGFSDLLTILIGLGGRHWVRAISGYDTVNSNDWWCKLWYYLAGVSAHYSNWVLMCLSLDRCIAVMFPMKAKEWLSHKRAIVCLTVLLCVLFALHSHAFPANKSIILNGSRACVQVDVGDFTAQTKDWTLFVLRAVVPGIVIVICNGVIILMLTRASQKRQEITQDQSEHQLGSIVFMLISISVAFVVFTAPFHVKWLLSTAFPADYVATSHGAAVNRLTWAVFIALVYVNYSINFVMYLISGKEFRQELLRWLRHLYRCSREPTRHDNTSSMSENSGNSTVVSKF